MDEEGVLPIGDYRDIGIMGKVSAGLLKTMDQSIDSISSISHCHQSGFQIVTIISCLKLMGIV